MGYGANALSFEAVEKIFKAKQRPSGNPLIILVDSIKMARQYMKQTNTIEETLMEHFWPGPLTIITKRKGSLPDNVTGGVSTIGIRIPNHSIALGLIQAVGGPIAAPSANISGTVSGTRVEDIKDGLQHAVSVMIDGGPSEIGMESTVVRVIDDTVHILRLGSITKEEIASLGLSVIVEGKDCISRTSEIENPSANLSHYQIGISCICVPYSLSVVETVEKHLKNKPNMKITVVTYEEHKQRYESLPVSVVTLGAFNDLTAVAKRLFSVLKELAHSDTELCIFEGIEEIGLGATIMDRIQKVCHKFS